MLLINDVAMTHFYLVLTLLSALSTYNIYRPIQTHKHGAVFSFLNGWILGELALHVMVVQIVGSLLFVWGGAVTGWEGAMGLTLSLASWGGLAFYTVKARETASIMRDALNTGLGESYAQDILPEFSHGLDIPLAQDRLIWPHKGLWSNQVEVLKNLAYAKGPNYTLRLDIRRNRNFTPRSPVLLQIHGGAWTQGWGSKNEQGLPLMNHLAEQGWICVSINYRLSPRATFPEHIIDCKKALVWVKQHIADYGGDPNFVVVTGGSAGGHLSALMAVTENLPAFQPGFEQEDTRVQGCISFYGIYDFLDENGLQTHRGLHHLLEKSILKVSKRTHPDTYRIASPIHHIHREVSPFMLIQGDQDSLVSARESAWFAQKLREKSDNPVVYVELPGAQHAFDVFPSMRSELTLQGIDRFLAWLYSQYLRQQKDDNQGEKQSSPQHNPKTAA